MRLGTENYSSLSNVILECLIRSTPPPPSCKTKLWIGLLSSPVNLTDRLDLGIID